MRVATVLVMTSPPVSSCTLQGAPHESCNDPVRSLPLQSWRVLCSTFARPSNPSPQKNLLTRSCSCDVLTRDPSPAHDATGGELVGGSPLGDVVVGALTRAVVMSGSPRCLEVDASCERDARRAGEDGRVEDETRGGRGHGVAVESFGEGQDGREESRERLCESRLSQTVVDCGPQRPACPLVPRAMASIQFCQEW